MNPETIRQVVKEVAGRHKEGYLIVRAQSRSEITIKLNNGRIENISTASERGMGVQAFTVRGASGFASANEIQVEKGRMLAEKALALAAENERLGCELNKNIFTQSPNTDELINYAIYKFDSFWPEQLKEFTALIHGRLREINFESATLAWQTSYRQVEDFWCIGRSDGTLVSFFIRGQFFFIRER
jgi:TldD protein